MDSTALKRHQAAACATLQQLCAQLGWQGELVMVDGDLVYQIPLPEDPDVCGAFFVVEAEEQSIRLYLTLPLNATPTQIAEASEFVIRCGYGRRFGALEFNVERGSLRVRVETDVTDATLDESVARLLDRAMALGREVSPGWRAIVSKKAKTNGVVGGSADG